MKALIKISASIILTLIVICLSKINCFAQSVEKVEIISVSKAKTGDIIPVLYIFRTPQHHINRHITGEYQISGDENSIYADTVYAKMGKGSVFTSVTASSDFTLSIDEFEGSKSIEILESISTENLSGAVDQDLVLTPDKDYRVTSDLIVSEGINLTIEPGCRIFMDEDVNIFVFGTMFSEGTKDNPYNVFSSRYQQSMGRDYNRTQ